MSEVKITDLDYRWISEEVYDVRKNKPGNDDPLKSGDLIKNLIIISKS